MSDFGTCMQVVTKVLWDSAATAYYHTQDRVGMQRAWHWAQQHAHAWVPPTPEGYLFLVDALTHLHEPLQGQHLL